MLGDGGGGGRAAGEAISLGSVHGVGAARVCSAVEWEVTAAEALKLRRPTPMTYMRDL